MMKHLRSRKRRKMNSQGAESAWYHHHLAGLCTAVLKHERRRKQQPEFRRYGMKVAPCKVRCNLQRCLALKDVIDYSCQCPQVCQSRGLRGVCFLVQSLSNKFIYFSIVCNGDALGELGP